MIDFSIVIPAYNEAKNLKILLPRLRSYLNDEDISYEIIVVDNASTDNTQDILKEIGNSIPRIVKVFEPVLGYGCAILKGLKKPKEIICVLLMPITRLD